jgi:hypothetical protein
MFEFSVSKDIKKVVSPMKFMLHKKGGGSREGSGTLMSNTNYQEIENWCSTR